MVRERDSRKRERRNRHIFIVKSCRYTYSLSLRAEGNRRIEQAMFFDMLKIKRLQYIVELPEKLLNYISTILSMEI